MSKRKVQVSMWLESNLLKKLDDMAKIEGRSRAAMIRRLLQLAPHPTLPGGADLRSSTEAARA